jgi:ribosomal protein S18 acetylase RimI-like enzyme
MPLTKNNDAIRVIKAEEVHTAGMAQCHVKSFPGSFMTEMGYYWLRALYRFFIRHNESICRIAIDANGKVVGLAVGGDPHIRDEFLNSALFRYPHLILWKFFSKRLVRRVLLQELAGKLQRKRTDTHSSYTKIPCSGIRLGNLLSICVLPDYQGAGIGSKLIESFQLACKDKGFQQLTLSVLQENSHAAAFYKKHGWRQSNTFGDSIRFVLDL